MNDEVYRSVRRLKIGDKFFFDISFFKSLQILEIDAEVRAIVHGLVPYLASKFTPDHFKRMQLHLHLIRVFGAMRELFDIKGLD